MIYKLSTLKKSSDSRVLLNVACGSKTHHEWNNIDFSPIIFFVHHPKISSLLNKLGLLSTDRYARILKIDPKIIKLDLRKGLPFESNTFDVIYHSHFLEHLDEELAFFLLQECYRCLKKSGIIRVVVPDLKCQVENYVRTYDELSKARNSEENLNNLEKELNSHKVSIHNLLYQLVIKEPYALQNQKPFLRFIEQIFRGDASKAGELHRWMYDQYTLTSYLNKVGFKNIQKENFFTSRINKWNDFKLDTDEEGNQYMPDSLYLEGVK